MAIDEAKIVMMEAVDVVMGHSLKSVYSLINFENMRFNKDLIDYMKEVSSKNEPYIIATAVTGLTSMTKLIAKSAIVLGKRNAKVCNSVEESKEWLHKASLLV